MEKTKLNFFQQIQTAIFKPTQYFKLSKVSGGRSTGFVFLFAFLISLFSIIPATIEYTQSSELTNLLNNNIPNFKLENGELSVANRYEVDENNVYVLVDTSKNSFSTDDVDHSYYQVILVSKTNLVMYQGSSTREIRFSELNGLSFDNSILKAIVPLINIIFFVTMIFVYLYHVALFYILTLLYSVLSLIVSAISNLNLRYSKMFKIALYGNVTSAIVTAIIKLVKATTSLNIPGLVVLLIGIIITCTYVVYGTLSHHNEETQEPTSSNAPMNY